MKLTPSLVDVVENLAASLGREFALNPEAVQERLSELITNAKGTVDSVLNKIEITFRAEQSKQQNQPIEQYSLYYRPNEDPATGERQKIDYLFEGDDRFEEESQS